MYDSRDIYLDHAATTPVSPLAVEVATELMLQTYGNPSSLHRMGFRAECALEEARSRVAKALGAAPEEILFTSGGTEANNLAIQGAAAKLGRRGRGIVITAVEHASVLEPCRQLERQGFRVTVVPPAADGSADIPAILNAVEEDTILVSAMQVNSETGAITNVQSLATAVKRCNSRTLFHTDAVQAFGKLPIALHTPGIDLLTISAHKIHAPKGMGALYLRGGMKSPKVLPLLYGGGQQQGLRPGTESVPLAGAFGAMAQQMAGSLPARTAHIQEVARYLRERVAAIPGIYLHSSAEGSPYIHNLSLPGYLAANLVNYCSGKGIYISGGSACSGGKPSYVLAAMGLPASQIAGAIRVSLSADNTTADIDALLDCLQSALRELAH